MAMAPLNLALGQPKSSGTSKWARILGGGLAGASLLPQLKDNKMAKDAMLSGGLGMLTSGSPWGAAAAIPSLVWNGFNRGQSPGSESGPYGPGINEPVLPDEGPLPSTPISETAGLPSGPVGQLPAAPAPVPRKSKWAPSSPVAPGPNPLTPPPVWSSPWINQNLGTSELGSYLEPGRPIGSRLSRSVNSFSGK